MNELRNKALLLKATDFGLSNRKDKRFYVVYDNKIINFGSKNAMTYIDYSPSPERELLRKNWRARHSKIKNKEGQYVYRLKTSADYWAWNLLW
jgi:hypothetical protein